MNYVSGPRLAAVLSMLLLISVSPSAHAESSVLSALRPTDLDARAESSRPGQTLSLATGIGYGLPIGPARDSDLEDVRYLGLFPSWSTPLASGLGSSSWYRGNLDLKLEGALLVNRRPETGYAAGGTALLHYEFLRDGAVIPYVELGVGFVFVDFDLDRQRDGFNFTPQAGVGFKYPLSEDTAITAGWRFHHISNAGFREPNTGLDDSLFLIGLSYSLGR